MPRSPRAILVAIAIVVGAAVVPTACSATARRTLQVGGATLHPCADGGGWCGSIRRPLDPARPTGRAIPIAFRWLPAKDGATSTAPTIVAVEGGPGSPSTASVGVYESIYGSLLLHRNLLLVDNRGTGGSAPIDCPSLQRFGGSTDTAAFVTLVGACAAQLDRTYGSGGADLFATAYAADDMAAVLGRLGLGPVDLYGDSYGTWFVQSFLSRHADRVHSVTLDSAYPVRGLDPWYASSMETARSAMDAACDRDAGCAAATAGEGTATDRLATLLTRLRSHPLHGATHTPSGAATIATVGPRQLVDLVQDAGTDAFIYRDLDPSVRAALAGDGAPLLRLAAPIAEDDGADRPAAAYSRGQYFAVSCVDDPQLFSMRSSVAARRAQLASSLAHPPARALSPFTAREWTSMDAYTEPFFACLDWPAPVHDAPVLAPHAPALPASVPVLVLGGDLDSLTPLADVRRFAPTLGATVRVVTLENAVHVTSEGDSTRTEGRDCAREIIRRFTTDPGALPSLDVSCAATIPPLHTAGAYPERLAQAAPAAVASGAAPTVAVRRAVTVAAGALGDATAHRVTAASGRGLGLRGGFFTATGGGLVQLRLNGVRFVSDAAVSGSATWQPDGGVVHGTLTVRPDRGAAVRVTLDWRQAQAQARARVGSSVLTLPAP